MSKPTLSFELNHLDPTRLQFGRGANNGLSLQIAGGDQYEPVSLRLAYPLTEPAKWLFVVDTSGNEIGFLESTAQLNPDSAHIVEEELGLTYLITTILAVKQVKARHGVTTWTVNTNRGERVVHVRDRTDIRTLPGGRVIITDVHGMHFVIPNRDALDQLSLEQIEEQS